MLDPQTIQKHFLNRTELAEHLSIDRASVNFIAEKFGLQPTYGVFPWHRVLKCIHRTDPVAIQAYCRTKLASSSMKTPTTFDFEVELHRPLLTIKEVAEKLGKREDTLSKAIREGRVTLPFHTLVLAPRIRRFRPFEVELWLETGISFGLPYAAADQVKQKHRKAANKNIEIGQATVGVNVRSIDATKRKVTTEAKASNAIFGAFAPIKRKNDN